MPLPPPLTVVDLGTHSDRELSIIITYYHLLSLIMNYYELLSIIINYYHLLSLIITYYELFSIIINYHRRANVAELKRQEVMGHTIAASDPDRYMTRAKMLDHSLVDRMNETVANMEAPVLLAFSIANFFASEFVLRILTLTLTLTLILCAAGGESQRRHRTARREHEGYARARASPPPFLGFRARSC